MQRQKLCGDVLCTLAGWGYRWVHVTSLTGLAKGFAKITWRVVIVSTLGDNYLKCTVNLVSLETVIDSGKTCTILVILSQQASGGAFHLCARGQK